MNVLDMPMSMLFPSELNTATSPTTTADAYPHSLLAVENSQEELILMHHQQLQHLRFQQQLQQHQRQDNQLQYEMAQIGLGSPPSASALMQKQNHAQHHQHPSQQQQQQQQQHQQQQQPHGSHILSLIDSAGRAQSSSHHAYSRSQQQSTTPSTLAYLGPATSQASAPIAASEGSFTAATGSAGFLQLGQMSSSVPSTTHSMMSYDFSTGALASPSNASIHTAGNSSPTIAMEVIKNESPSPLTPPVTAAELSHLSGCTDRFQCADHSHGEPFMGTSPNFTDKLSASSSSPYAAIGEYNDEQAWSSSSSDRDGSQECEPRFTTSPLMTGLHDYSVSYPPYVSRSRPKSTMMSGQQAFSTSPGSLLTSSSTSTQSYSTPFYKDSMSLPGSPSNTMVPYPRPDRRRSSSGTFGVGPIPVPSYGYGAGHHHHHMTPFQHASQQHSQEQHSHQHVPQQQHHASRPHIQYHPQQQHFQHLLDPSQVPEITDIHVCPVCQRRFTRPFNLRSHIMTHTTARPFPCDECHWKFTRQHDLLRHKRAKHPGSVPPLPPKMPRLKSDHEASR